MRTMTRRAGLRSGLTTAAAVLATFTLAAPAAPATAPTFDQQVLERTNTLRARHGVPPLALDATITRWAQEWADHLASIDDFEQRNNNKYGENAYYAWDSTGATPSGADVVEGWYGQINEYVYFGREPDMNTFSRWGQFTQVIWKKSAKMGVGRAKAANGGTYVVVNYDPPGNYRGQFAANVPAPK
ncbi:CAP family protein [Streptomyces sp. NPDC047315]|uniref:CAP family protein n=1 Tax=Streptomyces sp. NPDC047315 TaxID=3155142 RepID=UPI0034017855